VNAGATADKAIIAIGDSKTWYNGWEPLLATNLNATPAAGTGWVSYNAGANSAALQKTQPWQVDYMERADYYLENFTPSSCNTCDVLINFGVNDFSNGIGALNQTTWQNIAVALSQKARARWPNAKVYWMFPWNVGHDSDAATLKTWITNAISAANTAAGATYCFAGPDENVWLRCAGCLEDDTHYSHLGSPGPGNTAAASVWQTALGF
jgi:hypothetical protein